MSDEQAAVDALDQLGLTEYEARCFVALTRLEQGTAKEVSQLSDVPRSRIYDTVDRLHKRGLVDVQQSDPRKFRAVSKDAAFDKLRREYVEHIEAADAALECIESAETAEKKGMWAIADADHVRDRAVSLLGDADDHVHFIVADETTLHDDVLDQLAAVSDRGAAVVVEVASESIRDELESALPDARIVVSPGLQEVQKVGQKWPGQLVMVDHQSILASGLEDSNLPTVEHETAVWSHGHDHGFAAWMREILQDRTSRIDSSE